MLIGYARVSTPQQSLELQINELIRVGCEKLYQEKRTGMDRHRPELEKMLGYAKDGDTIVIIALDRLARSTHDLLDLVATMDEKHVHFRSLREPWADTTTTMGKFMLTVFGGMAEFERNLTIERCNAGREAALKRGVKFGRKPKLTHYQRTEVERMLDAGDAMRKIAKHFNVGPTTIHRIKQAMKEQA